MNKQNNFFLILFFIMNIMMAQCSFAQKKTQHSHHPKAHSTNHAPVTATISFKELLGHEHYSREVTSMIKRALDLADQHLAYRFGSADPSNKGMDCSGALYYLLTQENKADVPRQADQLYQWVYEKGRFYAVNAHHLNSFEFANLKPGDLFFWTGTYHVDRDPPITHVMLYLGMNADHQPLMFGASDGHRYQNKTMHGVSVFNFSLPRASSKIRFLGYGCIPSVNCEA